jgi:thymidylate synthase (FAD)
MLKILCIVVVTPTVEKTIKWNIKRSIYMSNSIEVTYVDHMGSDLSVANAARVSFGKKSEMDTSDVWGPPKLKDKDAKLIRYLAKHKHISPFGHCFASFHIKAPVFVARQLVKHKFLRWNEISRRYVDSEPEFYVPDVWRGRSLDKKQGSSGKITVSSDIARDMAESAKKDYEYLLDLGVCPEQARMVLPQSMMTEWYWSGSLDAFADMCALRCKPDTQAETAEVAWEIDCSMVKLFPVSWRALRENE